MFKMLMYAVLEGIEPQSWNRENDNPAQPKTEGYKTLADMLHSHVESIKSRGFRAVKIPQPENDKHVHDPNTLNDKEFCILVEKLAKMRERKGFYELQNTAKTIRTHITYDLTKKNPLIYPAIAAAAILFLGIFFRPLIVTGGFIALAVISRMYQKHIRLQLGVDLAVFGTVICGALFGPIYGTLVGLLAYPISIVYTKEEARYLPVAMGGIALVGIIAGIANIAPADIVLWGVGLTAFYDILTSGLYYYIYRAPIIGGIVFSATHIVFNYFVFSSFGAFVINFLR